MDLIVEIRFGAHLYGTHTPDSDLDLKGVYLPEPRDILLQRVRSSITSTPIKARGEKNAPSDVDREAYSLQRYLELLSEGQTVALDMLFAPETAMTMPPRPLWRQIQAQASRLVSRRASGFLRYCQQQANKYGIKGSRVATARQALGTLSAAEARLGTRAKLEEISDSLAKLALLEHVALSEVTMPGGRSIRHIEICGRSIPFTASIKTAREIAQRIVEEFGQRALQAERNEGVDWKALSHAVRVGREAIELFESGRITFPLPCADHIRRIKAGEISYAAVAHEIETLLVEVETASARSSLPETPDPSAIDELVTLAYRRKILECG